jgi:chromosome segregation ATPase
MIIGSVYILRRRKPKGEKKPVTAPKRTDLDGLLELYKERIALLIELEEFDHNLDRKAVSREHFDRRMAEISRRQQEILRNISRLEVQLEASQPSISDKLQTIKNAEVDLERASNDLRSLDTRFRAKRISRADYAQKHREALKRLGQARRRIEQVINTLQAGS